MEKGGCCVLGSRMCSGDAVGACGVVGEAVCLPDIPVSPSHEVPCGTVGPSDGCPRAGGVGMARAGRADWAHPKRDGCCCWLSTGRSQGGLISRALNQCQSEQGRWGQHLLLSKGVGSQRKAASVSCRAWQPGASSALRRSGSLGGKAPIGCGRKTLPAFAV